MTATARTRSPFPLTRLLALLGMVTLLLMASMVAWSPVSAQPTPVPADAMRTITVQGTGIVSTTPDTASVTLGVRQTNESLKAAQDDVSGRAARLTQMLTDNGIAEEDVKTTNYSINPIPEYDRNGNYEGISGYEVSLALTVTIRDLQVLGTILDQSVEAGANDIWGISMFVDDTAEAANQARAAAMADARARADELARAEGLLITGVFMIHETSAPEPAAERMYDAMEADAAGEAPSSVPISAGSSEIRVDVIVVYIIEQGNG
jgi:hypothetical protein